MIRVRPMELADRPWVNRLLEDAFADATVARKGVLMDASVLPGFVATEGGRPVGFLTYDAAHGDREVVAIISVEEGRGIGRALMDAAHEHAVAAGCRRLWVVTTNDNTRTFRFYQLWGWACAPSTATACAARGGLSLRSRNGEPTVFCWNTSSSSSFSWRGGDAEPGRIATPPRTTLRLLLLVDSRLRGNDGREGSECVGL
jgi:GNAT superfamily N-acetyltransferase